jgi:hypothetical protein
MKIAPRKPANQNADAESGPPEKRPVDHATPGRQRVRHRAEIAHATRGRVRLKVHAAKHDPDLLNQIKAAFEGVPGIGAIDVRPGSESLVIHYDPTHHADVSSVFQALGKTVSTPAADLAMAAATAHRPPPTKLDELATSIEDEAEFLAEHSKLARGVVDCIRDVDRQIKRATNNHADLKILVPVGLIAYTVLEIGAAAATPMWITLALFSLNHFVELRAHTIRGDKSN